MTNIDYTMSGADMNYILDSIVSILIVVILLLACLLIFVFVMHNNLEKDIKDLGKKIDGIDEEKDEQDMEKT